MEKCKYCGNPYSAGIYCVAKDGLSRCKPESATAAQDIGSERDVIQRAREVWRKLASLVGAECVDEIASALRAERERALEECAKIANSQRRNTSMLASNPPQSGAAFDIAAMILALKERKP